MPITYHDAGRTIQRRLTSSVEAGQLVEAVPEIAVDVNASPTANVGLTTSISKKVDHPVYDRTPSSSIDVGQKVTVSVDEGVAIGVTPTASIGLNSSISKEVDHPVYDRTLSSSIDVGQLVDVTVNTAQNITISPTSPVSVSSSVTTEVDDPNSATLTFSDGTAESFTKEGPNTASHSASWQDGQSPYDFKIFKSSSETTQIYSELSTFSTSDSDSGYATPDISDLGIGDSVYFKVTDDNGNTDTTSVSVGVSGF